MFLYCVVIYILFQKFLGSEFSNSLIFFDLSKILIFETNWYIFCKILHIQAMTSLSNRNKN